MTTVAGWCLDELHRNRCKSERCTCDCHTVRRGAWWGLGTPTQVALSWLVRVTRETGGGMPFASDLMYLRALARDRYAEQTDEGDWRATALGFGLRDSQYDTEGTRTT